MACSGGVASLETGIRGATSVYYARIVAASESWDGFFDPRLDVGRVVRGTGHSPVTRVSANEACSPIEVGDVGVVVLGSVDSFA